MTWFGLKDYLLARELRYVRASVRVAPENDRGVDVGESEEHGGIGNGNATHSVSMAGMSGLVSIGGDGSGTSCKWRRTMILTRKCNDLS